MSEEHSMLYIGISDFAEPTLLLIGDASSFKWLAGQIEERKAIDFATMPDFIKQINVTVRLIPTNQGGGVDRRGSVFNWSISMSESKRFAEQLKELAASTSPAHAYMDAESNASGVGIVASKGEYDRTTVFISPEAPPAPARP